MYAPPKSEEKHEKCSPSPSVCRLTCPQFDVGHLHLSSSTPLGAGAVSHVVHSHLSFSRAGLQTPISVKIISKIQLLQQRKVESIMNEKEALLRLAPSPFIVRLFGTAQSEDELYFILEWLPHGDLLQHIRRCTLKRKKEYRKSVHEKEGETAQMALRAPLDPLLHANSPCRSTTSPPLPPSVLPESSGRCDGLSPPNANAPPTCPLPHGDGERSGKASSSPSLSIPTAFPEPPQAPSTSSSSPLTAMGRAEAPLLRTPPSSSTSSGGGGGARPPSIPSSSHAIRCLDFPDIQLIAAQLVLGLHRVITQGVVLRDLKPENIAFDDHYRACFIDFDTVDFVRETSTIAVPVDSYPTAFLDTSTTPSGKTNPLPTTTILPPQRQGGSSGQDERPSTHTEGKESAENLLGAAAAPPRPPLTVSDIQRMRERNASFCGTAQHVSPEMLATCSWSFSSDLWALGTTLYECVYGKAMFSGACTFDVLTKIVKNGPPAQHVLFPTVHFVSSSSFSSSLPQERAGDYKRHSNGEEGTSSVPTATTTMDHSVSSSSSPFERLKDFILRLVQLNPRERLGVAKASGKFDVAALRGHPFFADFDWRVVDEHVRTYRAHDFRNPPSVLVSSSSTPSPMYTYEDGTPSLARWYRDVPFNDDHYAAYVYDATADADPFQEFFLRGERVSSTSPSTTAKETPDASSPPSPSMSSSHATTTQETTLDGSTPPHTEVWLSSSSPPEKAPHPDVGKEETTDVTQFPSRPVEQNEDTGKETATPVERDVDDDRRCSEEEDDVIDDVGIRFQGLEPNFSGVFHTNTIGDDDAS